MCTFVGLVDGRDGLGDIHFSVWDPVCLRKNYFLSFPPNTLHKGEPVSNESSIKSKTKKKNDSTLT